MNCTDTCPKGLNPAKAIGEIKQLIVERQVYSETTRRERVARAGSEFWSRVWVWAGNPQVRGGGAVTTGWGG